MNRLVSFLIVTVLVSGSAMSYQKQWDFSYCGDVVSNFIPCLGFIQGQMDDPTKECCWGVLTLNSIAKQNHSAPQIICKCIEEIALGFSKRTKYSKTCFEAIVPSQQDV
ncbi:protein ARABIDOPSIS THALIANA ANTHER 7-like [Hevea brasiliensis]|uniref:protein ARABIDOPSIS THALIANA ANTHER 7-like n=1 Tax=Hevea brasiliensis TaxID=3981 RepID=UPI0025D28139|nr:protein ARABIDOPSIS THALIANA ANTHER 7-like [Hevea brasiliensis]